MDELSLLTNADRTPLPDPAELAPARARLLAAIHAEPARGRSRRRLVASGAVVVGLAAAITAVIALGPLEEAGIAPPKASAAEVLHQAAVAARTMPDVVPRPDQFVYSKSQYADGSTREAWLSADGTHDGLVEDHGERLPVPGCVAGQVRPPEPKPCEPSPAYLADLPTDAAGMVDYLQRNNRGEPGDLNALAKEVYFLTGENYVRPESRAALFEALGKIDGLTLVDDVTDPAGRHGVGASWTSDDTKLTMVLDRETHALLGMWDYWALLDTAIVDQAGQRP